MKLIYRILFHAIFNQGGIIFKSATSTYRAEFSDWLKRVLRCRIPHGCHHGKRLWNCLYVKWLRRVIQWTGRQEHDAGHDESIHDTVTWNRHYFVFICPRTPLMYRHHATSRIQSNNVGAWLHSNEINRAVPTLALTVEQLFYSSDCSGTGRATWRDAKS